MQWYNVVQNLLRIWLENIINRISSCQVFFIRCFNRHRKQLTEQSVLSNNAFELIKGKKYTIVVAFFEFIRNMNRDSYRCIEI